MDDVPVTMDDVPVAARWFSYCEWISYAKCRPVTEVTANDVPVTMDDVPVATER